MALTAQVIPGELVESAWGNEIRDRTVQVFASAAERTAQWPTPPQGALSFLDDVNVLYQFDTAIGWWPIGAAGRVSTDSYGTAAVGQVALWPGPWYLQGGAYNDGSNTNLYIRGGSPTGPASFGIAWANGHVLAPYAVQTPQVYAPTVGLTLAGSPTAEAHIRVGLGPSGTTQQTVTIFTQPPSDDWAGHALVLARNAGLAQTLGLAFGDYATGWTAAWQMYQPVAGLVGLHATNGQNTAHIPVIASAFTVSVLRRNAQALDTVLGTRALGAVDSVRPVRFEDLSAELTAPMTDEERLAGFPEGTDLADLPPRPAAPSTPDRYGFDPDELAAVAPELVTSEGEDNGYSLPGVVAVLWQAVRQLNAIVKVQDARIAALEGGTP